MRSPAFLLTGTLAAATACLTGCYSLPLDPVNTFPQVIRSPLPGDVAYARIYAASRECYATGNPRLTFEYSAQTKSGVLRYTTGITTSATELAQIEVRSDVAGSVVLMRLQGDVRNPFLSAVPAWLDRGRPPCPFR
jgi:hypothetical protein